MKMALPLGKVACISIMLLCFIGGWQTYTLLTHVQQRRYIIDARLSLQAHSQFKEYADALPSLSLADYADHLQQTFGWISRVIIRQAPHKKRTHIAIKAAQPWCRVNEWYVTTENNVVPVAAYKDHHIPYIHYSGKELSPQLIRFIRSLPTTVLDAYTITIKDIYRIMLTKKDEPSINILTTATHPPTEQELAELSSLIKKKLTSYKGKYGLVGDMRFAHQYILGEYKGDR